MEISEESKESYIETPIVHEQRKESSTHKFPYQNNDDVIGNLC